MLKKIWVTVLLFLFLGGLARISKADDFSIRSGITWRSTINDLQALEGKARDKKSLGNIEVLKYDQIQACGINASLMCFYFVDGQLFMVSYDFFNEIDYDETFETLNRALTGKYGEPGPLVWEDFIDKAQRGFGHFYGGGIYIAEGVQWELSDSTLIVAMKSEDRLGDDWVDVVYVNGGLVDLISKGASLNFDGI